jgi:hypothetical protein
MRVLIETYRGFEISFDPGNEKFWYLSERYDSESSSKSFSAIKKAVDDFIKENKDFKPFWIENNLTKGYGYQKLKIVGIRKDGAFVFENSKGEKEQLSKHNEDNYIVYNEANDELHTEIAELEDKANALNKEIRALKAKQIGTPLTEYKQTLI